jgi:hypothetical protein
MKDEMPNWQLALYILLIMGFPFSVVVATISGFFYEGAVFLPLFGVLTLGAFLIVHGFEKKKKENELYYQKRKQETNLKEIRSMLTNSERLVRHMPKNVSLAEQALDNAIIEYNDGAFSPFWDEIEKSVKSLALFQVDVNRVLLQSKEYKERSKNYDPEVLPLFHVTAFNFPNPTKTQFRLKSIVREAQKNFQFATIYEQRKTNQILVKGFGSLAEAISEMGGRIATSIDALADVVEIGFADQNMAIEGVAQDVPSERS